MTVSWRATESVDDSRTLFRERDVAWLWVGQVIAQIGDGLSKMALLWFVYHLTGSALKMTLTGILETLPPLFLGPFIGVYLDRVSKRRAMIVIDLVRACLLILNPSFHTLGWLTLEWLYVLVFIIALFSTAYGPALSSALPLLVDTQHLTRVTALMQSSMMIGQLMGPAASGILIATIDAQNVLHVTAGAFTLSPLCKIPVKIPHQPVPSSHAMAPSQKAGRALSETLDLGDCGALGRSGGLPAPVRHLPCHDSRVDCRDRGQFRFGAHRIGLTAGAHAEESHGTRLRGIQFQRHGLCDARPDELRLGGRHLRRKRESVRHRRRASGCRHGHRRRLADKGTAEQGGSR